MKQRALDAVHASQLKPSATAGDRILKSWSLFDMCRRHAQLRGRASATRPTVHDLGLNMITLWIMIHNRKNWIHVGSQKAGPKVAAILSIVESCRQLKIPIREYLAAVLPG